MKTILLLLFLIPFYGLNAQTPKLYLNIVSHNEPKDSLQKSNEFNRQAYWVPQIANIIQSKGAKYNLQTCDGFIDGAISYQSATSGADVLETLDDMPNVEIDPRYKSYKAGPGKRNYADNAYLLTSIGVNPTHVLGGFLYSSTTGSPDWFPFENTTQGNAYPTAFWAADLLYGPGSFPPHQNDLNDFGVWKPDNINTFYQHNSSRHLWMIGNGCAPLMDSLTDTQPIIDSIQSFCYKLSTGIWPSNKFYSATIMINQSEFGPMLYSKLEQVLDSINITCSSTVEWKLLTEKFSAFQNWQTSSSLEYSQWLCGQNSVGLDENNLDESTFQLFPNPTKDLVSIKFNDNENHLIEVYDLIGNRIISLQIHDEGKINLSNFSQGLYFVNCDGKSIKKLIKE